MKSILNKIVSIAMVFLLLASTTSWTVGKHYCMGRLMDVTFFDHAEDCGMNMAMMDDDGFKMADSDTCCNDEIVLVQGQDDLKLSFNEFSLDQQLFLVSFAHSYFFLFSEYGEDLIPPQHYPPPILVKDIQLLDEVFLI